MTTDEIFTSTRKEYRQGVLDEASVAPCPLDQFRTWFDEALKTEPQEPNACALATVGRDLKPSSRMVLLKQLDDRGFVFFTNYQSKKGQQMSENPQACLLFYWATLERSVRIEGIIEKVSSQESSEYFSSRPRASQLGALVSKQSEHAPTRAEMELALQKLEAECKDQDTIQRPEHWGGYRLKPETYEFWQGRENRLHDRIRYQRSSEGWKIERLWP
jgi:pyridoxamine 5'-phosphate oxidase